MPKASVGCALSALPQPSWVASWNNGKQSKTRTVAAEAEGTTIDSHAVCWIGRVDACRLSVRSGDSVSAPAGELMSCPHSMKMREQKRCRVIAGDSS